MVKVINIDTIDIEKQVGFNLVSFNKPVIIHNNSFVIKKIQV